MTQQFRINGRTIDIQGQGAGEVVRQAYLSKTRPLCICRQPNPEMYIAKAGDTYIVKRMPNTGAKHDPNCDSYELPAELSGLGQVAGSAIKEDVESGITELKLDFSLTKTGSRAAPAAGEGEADTVRTDGRKLTLRGALHYLWDQAGFNRWTPAMEGKRNWGVIRRYLTDALSGKEAKGGALAPSIYIPETYNSDQDAAINQRRSAKLAPLNASGKTKRLMVLIAEVKDITESQYGYKIIAKHLPRYHFMLASDIYTRMGKRFARELGLWRENLGGHLIVVATFGVGPTGFASIEEASLMMVTPEWIPIEDSWDQLLVRGLVDARRNFIKGLRYNLPSNKPLASVVLNDTRPDPVAMYVIPDDADEKYRAGLEELTSESKLASWFWTPNGDPELPSLPRIDGYRSMGAPLIGPAQAATVSVAHSSTATAESLDP